MLGLSIFNHFRKNRMHQSEEIGTTGLYIDVENLQDRARTVIEGLIADWPVEVPKLRQLNLYVRADQAQLWELWASSKFPGIQINVKGIQHFSLLAKNSADITIAVDAISDFLTKKVSFICLLSDDSDFISVYAKVRELQPQKQVPFRWILTDREGTKSTTIRDYFPNDHIHVVRFPSRDAPTKNSIPSKLVQSDSFEDMAITIIQQLPTGNFKSTDCQEIIKQSWPSHHLAKASGPNFGTEFANKIWPFLGERGVNLIKQKPRRYEMTREAKNSVH